MKIENFERVKAWWNIILPSQTGKEYQDQFKVSNTYEYVDETYSTLIYVIVLNCEWQVELMFDDGGQRASDSIYGRWYLTLRDLEGVFYRKPIDYDILIDKIDFIKTVMDLLNSRLKRVTKTKYLTTYYIKNMVNPKYYGRIFVKDLNKI